MRQINDAGGNGRPFTGARVETGQLLPHSIDRTVAPSQGRELKQTPAHGNHAADGRPFTGARVETVMLLCSLKFLFVAPSQGRELKQEKIKQARTRPNSRPFTGARVETSTTNDPRRKTSVAPSQGRELKQLPEIVADVDPVSPLHRGAS